MADQHGTTATSGAAAQKAQMVMVIKAMVFPLFFVVMFALCYISAFHNPTPHNVELALVGPAQQTSVIADQLAAQSPGAFEVTATTDLGGALDDLGSQRVAGVIELGQPITAHVASGGGITVSQTVETVAQTMGDATGIPVVVDDVAPLGSGDATGMGLFYFLVICTIAGYLTITVLSQVAPRMALRRQLAVLGSASVLFTAIAFGVSAIFVGAYGATAVGVVALLAIGIAYTFTVGLVSILFNKLLGQAAIFLVMTFAIFLNFPSAGGAIPAGFLPGFWNMLHNFWIGSGAMQAMRSVIFFGGSGVGAGLLILGGWLAAAAVVLAALVARDRKKAVAQDAAELAMAQ